LYEGFKKWLRFETLMRVRKEKIMKNVEISGGILFRNHC